MSEGQWKQVYNQGAADTQKAIVAWLRLLSSAGYGIVDTNGIAVRVERGDYGK